MEHPSSKQCSARPAALGFAVIVSRVNFVWGSQKVDLQEVQRQR
jgi:hypothetical protein